MSLEVEHNDEAQQVLRRLRADIEGASVACPLCGSMVPARGLQVQSYTDQKRSWRLVFTCPACGLVSRFAQQNVSVKQLHSIHGSAWTNELRQYHWLRKAEDIPHAMSARPRHFIGVAVISFLTWMVLIGSFSLMDMLWGLVVSVVVARFSYRFVAFDLPRWVTQPRRWAYFLDLLGEFVRQLIVQNVTLSIRVFRPDLPIRPGIVAVPTRLRGDVNLTILGSLMSLTPDTVTMDIDSSEGMIYLHWIDVQSLDRETMRRLLVSDLEERMIRWLL